MKLQQVLAVALATAVAGQAAELPVRHVVLYKHGVGYFERAGELAAGEGGQLSFNATDMNDVLKSLTVDVKGAGAIAGLRYDSSEPVEQKLQQFPITIDKQQPLSALVDQLKGAELELKSGSSTITGQILSARLVAGSREQAEKEQVTLLLGSGEIRAFEIGAGVQIRFTDPRLQQQLKDYLNTLLQGRNTEKRTIYIDSVDSGRRQVTASYMVPVPIWKSSYRLLFQESAEPMLEGWAIVDNTTGEDWTNVRLSVISGRPISFISRLYEPRFITRPTVDLAEDRAAAPVLHGGAIGGLADAVMNRPAPARAALPAAAAPSERRENVQLLMEAESKASPSSLAATAQGREAGELFEYRFDKPVTVRKSQSAMLPFLQQRVSARKLLIYSNPSAVHPTNAAEVMNASGKTLDGGPITVYDAGVYAGEALFETVKTGDKRLVSYGVDLGTRVTTAFDSDAALVREIHVRNGVLTSRLSNNETRTYTVRNVDAKAKTLIIEHPVRPGYKLLNLKPWETTATAYRFEVKLAPSAETKFPVREERVFDQTHMISNITPDFLLTLLSNRSLTAEGKKALELILDKKRKMADLDRQAAQAEAQVREVGADQQRTRQNIESLNRVSGQQDQVQRYARQLADQETRLVTLRDQLTELRRNRAALESELNTLINSTEF